MKIKWQPKENWRFKEIGTALRLISYFVLFLRVAATFDTRPSVNPGDFAY